MLDKVTLKNFRSAEEAVDLRLAPITVLYGPSASGKSTLLYSLLVLKNFIQNPNRPADNFFDLGFMNLGGFDACVLNHESERNITIGTTFDVKSQEASYSFSFSKNAANINFKLGDLQMHAQISLPYAINQSFPFGYADSGEDYTINWNGIGCSVLPKKPTAETQKKAAEITASINSVAETLKRIGIAPHRRGFFKPSYSAVTPSANPTSEDEVASIIMNDPHMAARISTYMEDVFDRDFRIYTPPGTATAFLQTTEKKSRIPVNLVNDGSGIVQVVYLLAKMYQVDVDTLLIEEPEVYLHPSVVRNFAKALCTFVQEEKKQIILTTHSESFLLALLNAVSDKLISPADIVCYLTTKSKKTTVYAEQKIEENGQIEGGLASFIEAETEDLKKFLKV